MGFYRIPLQIDDAPCPIPLVAFSRVQQVSSSPSNCRMLALSHNLSVAMSLERCINSTHTCKLPSTVSSNRKALSENLAGDSELALELSDPKLVPIRL